jgi:sulfate adenylyltransferase large subunit
METESLRFVIVGHIDHGKSTLIGRLFYDTDCLPEEKIEEVRTICDALGKEMEFAYVMDHLEEERTQGITIDTTQTFFHTEKRDYVIIDAPGHREFTKNMITGASQAEAAILIVDADEGVQEQTRRHAYILGLLGLEQVIVVINKMDLVDFDEVRFNKVSDDIREFLTQIGTIPTYVIPISAKDGDNIASKSERMAWFQGPIILHALDSFKSLKDREDNPLRFPVQDVYNIDNKRIIAGRVESGTIKTNDEILVLPSGERTTVSSVEEYLNEEKTRAVAGESTGITVKDKLFIDRGDVICIGTDKPVMTNEIRGNVFWMDKEPLRTGESVYFKCSTQESKCLVKAIERRMDSSTLEIIEENADVLENREVGEVLLNFSNPIIVDNFNDTPDLGRFVIEKRFDTAGGGIITDLGGRE